MSVSAETGAEIVQERPAETRFGRGALVDVVFLVLVVATASLWVHDTAGEWFSVDDWLLANQAQHARGLLTPFNGNMSLVMIAVYRVMFGIWGFSTYLPFRIVGAASLGGVTIAMYFTAKGRIGRPLATVAAAILLWPHLLDLTPAALNHWLGLIAGIGCAYVLNQPERRGSNALLGGLLTFALASAAGGVAFAVGSILFCFCVRPSTRRWLAVIAPTILWGIWWLTKARDAGDGMVVHLGTGQKARTIYSGLWNTLVTCGGGNVIVATVISLLIFARVVQVARHGRDESANAFAWLTSAVFWWVGVVWQRGTYSSQAVFRYQFYAIALILLSMMPRQPLVWPQWVHYTGVRSRAFAASAVPVVVVAGLIAGNWTRTRDSSRILSVFSIPDRPSVMVANLGASVIPDQTIVGGYLRAETLRDNLAYYGGAPRDADGRDRIVLDLARKTPVDTTSAAAACVSLTMPFVKGVATTIDVTGAAQPVSLQARITGRRWQKVIGIGANETVRIQFPTLAAVVPIHFRTEPTAAPVKVQSGLPGSQACLS